MAPVPKRRHRTNFNVPGQAHELTFSCYRRYPFLARERVCRWLVNAIEAARKSLEFDLWAWVFMPDHVHLIIRPNCQTYDIAHIRRQIKEPVARHAISWLREHSPDWMAKLTRQRGDRTETLFWQSGGGYDRNITEPATLLRMIDYIHLNPVRKQLVERACDWPWSSAGWFLGDTDSPLNPDPIPAAWLLENKLGP